MDGCTGIWTWVPNIQHEKIKESTVGLLSGKFFDVKSPSLSVDGLDLAFSSLEGASHDLDGVSLADGDGSHVVLGLQFLIQVATHDLSSQV